MVAPAAAGTVAEALAASVDALTAAGVETPRLDAELLLSDAIGSEREQLVATPESAVDPPAARRFGAMVRRRCAREPVAYVLGRKGFRRIELAVDRRALVPRPETEHLVELAVERQPGRVLDVGTGCGAVALAVADELPGATVIATDSSQAALELAAANAERLGIARRVRFEQGAVPEGERFDLVLANLPYVRGDEWPGLAPEITRYEPREALLGGGDGLEVIRALAPALVGAVADRGAVGLEIGAGQAAEVEALLREAGCSGVERRQDLAGIERVVVGVAADAGQRGAGS